MVWKLMVGVAAVVLFGAACTSSSDDGLSITSFDVPSSADCDNGELGMVDVSWDTDKTTDVALAVDGQEILAGALLSGDHTAEVMCDGEDHDIELTASDDDGNSVSETETGSTEAPSGGGGGGGSGSTTSTTSSGGPTTTSTTTTTTSTTTTTTTLPPTPSDVIAPVEEPNLPFNTR